MKRDMNLIRLILLQVEAEEESEKPDLSQYSEEQMIYNKALLIEAGLLKGQVVRGGESPLPISVYVNQMTWAGHEFLDNVRSETVWNKTKETIGDKVGSVSLAIVQEVAKASVKSLLGLA